MNAIILAAGLGSRFGKITQHTHKALLPIHNTPNLERTVQYLIQADIHEIHIVTGHLATQFGYIAERYGCHLIHNEKYREYNSLYSFFQAADYFGNSFVVDSDVVLAENLFLHKPTHSGYFTILRPESSDVEWIPRIDTLGRVTHIDIAALRAPSLLGISYWTKNDADIIKKHALQYLSEEFLSNSKLYWDNIPMKLFDQIYVRTYLVSENSAYEMDNWDNYQFVLKNLA